MKTLCKFAWMGGATLLLAGLAGSSAFAQVAEAAPIIANTAVPMVVQTVKPKMRAGIAKFEGFVMNANTAQITVRARGSDMSIQTFPLDATASAKMQHVMDRGGYQYGDKVTIFYDTNTKQAVKIRGKPSRPI
jgi:hypothetical protein